MTGRTLALDVGDRRIGIAVSTGFLATPVGVHQRLTLEGDVARVAELVAEYEAETIVVGLPVNMSGTEGPQATKTREFAKTLEASGLNVVLWDERLTTVEARRMLEDRGMKRRHIDSHVDELAATLILEGYLMSVGADATL